MSFEYNYYAHQMMCPKHRTEKNVGNSKTIIMPIKWCARNIFGTSFLWSVVPQVAKQATTVGEVKRSLGGTVKDCNRLNSCLRFLHFVPFSHSPCANLFQNNNAWQIMLIWWNLTETVFCAKFGTKQRWTAQSVAIMTEKIRSRTAQQLRSQQ